ncbi:TerD family protein [Streptomyces sp. NPDC020412]|uniref:TerD family protein n=1 Tax=Streptomyces sp. NPDC020412 TaxID=3365073 RepID=UPI0037AE8B43
MANIPWGANAPVPTAPLRLAVGHALSPAVPAFDALVLLLDAGGTTRPGRGDVVAASQTPHPSGTVAYAGRTEGNGQVAVWLDVNLPVVEPEVQRIVVVAAVEGTAFGAVPGLYVQVQGYDGVPVARYDVMNATTETAIVLGELYRRDGTWKFRAVGQGYAGGLAAVAAEFGLPGAASRFLSAVPAPPPPPPAFQASAYQHQGGYPAQGGYQPSNGYPSQGGYAAQGYLAAPQVGSPRPPVPGHSYSPGHRIIDYVAPVHLPEGAVPAQGYAPAVDYQPAYDYQPASYAAPVASSASVGSAGSAAPGAPAVQNAPAADDPFERFHSFPPQTMHGRGYGTVSFPEGFARGPVILEATYNNDDWVKVQQLNLRREPGYDLLSESGPAVHSRAPAVAPGTYALCLNVLAGDADWSVTALPLSAARRLLPGQPVHGESYDVLAYAGPDAELEVAIEDAPGMAGGFITLVAMSPHDIDEAAADFEGVEFLLSGATGPFRQTVRLQGGTRLLTVQATECRWSITARPTH